MIAVTLSLFSLIAFGATQSSTVSLFIPGSDGASLVGSIAGSDASATTYVITCASSAAMTTAAAATGAAQTAAGIDGLDDGSDDDSDGECGFPSAFTVTQGPSTVKYGLDFDDTSDNINCQLFGSTRAICTESVSGAAVRTQSEPPLQTATLSASDITFYPVVITAGSANAKSTASTKGGSSASTGTSKTMASTGSATAKSTNAAMQGSPLHGAGVLGALGVAVAGAML